MAVKNTAYRLKRRQLKAIEGLEAAVKKYEFENNSNKLDKARECLVNLYRKLNISKKAK